MNCKECLWQDDWNDPKGTWCYQYKEQPKNCSKFVELSDITKTNRALAKQQLKEWKESKKGK